MANNRSKVLQKPTNPKKSVKQNRNSIRLYILFFYTIIFTTALKIVQIVVSFRENHRTANRAKEPHVIWQRLRFLFFPFPSCPARLLPPPPLPQPLAIPMAKTGLCRGERFGPENLLVGLGEQ